MSSNDDYSNISKSNNEEDYNCNIPNLIKSGENNMKIMINTECMSNLR